MKKKYFRIQKILIILFILYPFNCFADYNWKKIKTSSRGDNVYVDLTSIKRSGNNVYFLKLRDYLKPDKFGDLSNIIYHEVNCVNMEFKFLKDFYYKQKEFTHLLPLLLSYTIIVLLYLNVYFNMK